MTTLFQVLALLCMIRSALLDCKGEKDRAYNVCWTACTLLIGAIVVQ